MQNAYASRKTWIRTFTLALAKEYRASGTGEYAFNLGLMGTDLLQKIEVVAGYEDKVMPLNTIIRMWAKAPEIPARRAVWLASAATDGKTGLEVRELSLGWMLAGALKEGFRLLTRRQPKAQEVQVSTVPSYHPSERVNHRGAR